MIVRMSRALSVGVLVVALVGSSAGASGQRGDNSRAFQQRGASASGDSVAGPSRSVVGIGHLRAEIRNGPNGDSFTSGSDVRLGNVPRGEIDVRTGDAAAGNASAGFVGVAIATGPIIGVAEGT